MRLHTGEPAIYGAIGEQMDALDRLGIDYEVVPGISAFQAAAADAEGRADRPRHCPDDHPHPHAGPHAHAALGRPLAAGPVPGDVVHLPLDRSNRGADRNAGRAITGRIARRRLVYHASWPDEKIIRGTLGDIGERVRRKGSRGRPFSWWGSPWNGPREAFPSSTTRRSATVIAKAMQKNSMRKLISWYNCSQLTEDLMTDLESELAPPSPQAPLVSVPDVEPIVVYRWNRAAHGSSCPDCTVSNARSKKAGC